MATSIANAAALEVVNAAIDTVAQDIFKNRVPAQYQAFTYERGVTGKKVVLPVMDGVPQVREWFGSRVVETLRAWSVEKGIRRWESTIKVAMDDIEQDPEGLVASTINNFRLLLTTAKDKIVFDELFVNDTGPDGFDDVPLFSAAHARKDTLAAQSNITTEELDYKSLRDARRLMRSFTNYAGEPLGMAPKLLIVGPELEETAQVLTGSDKPATIGHDGNLTNKGYSDEPSSAGTFVHSNFVGGSINVLVSDRVTGKKWALVDTSKGSARPLYLATFREARIDEQTDNTDDVVFYEDAAVYGYSAKATPMAMCWQTAYGNPSAS